MVAQKHITPLLGGKRSGFMKIIKYISVLLCLALTFTMLSACHAKPTDSSVEVDNRVIITAIKKAILGQNYMDGAIPKGTHITDELRYLMYKNKGQDVWFRVFYSFTDQQGYYEKYNAENEGFSDDEFSKFMTAFKQQELDFATSIGAKNISKKVSSDYPESCTMEVTADMISKIFERGNMSFDIAHPARIDGYSKKISDTLTDYISKMSDTDTLEIAAVMVYDNLNSYALRQDIGANSAYGDYVKFYQGVNETFVECDALLEQTIVDILTRNNILEKRIISEGLPQIGPDSEKYPNSMTNEYIFEEMSAGFNAVLTKSEILKLAEDPEIKVIYLAPQK